MPTDDQAFADAGGDADDGSGGVATDSPAVRRMMVFFALAYATQGFAQYTGLLYQPVQYYFKQNGYGAEKMAAAGFVITIAWYLKPVYGLISDFLPVWGYRRFVYLIAVSICGIAAFGLLAALVSPAMIVYLLLAVAFCTAIGDVMTDGLMVETGQATGRVRLFQGIQWTSVSAVGVLAALGGGYLAQIAETRGEPEYGVRVAALIAIAGPALLLAGTLALVRERRRPISARAFRETLAGMAAAGRSRALLGVAFFCCFFWFQPGLISPFYLHVTETLGISERMFGLAGSWAQGGYLLGALVFMLVLSRRLHARQLATVSILLYAGSTLMVLTISGNASLAVYSLCAACAYMIANLTLLSLAAEVCPKRVEAFVFASVMALVNFSKQTSEWVGGRMYDRMFDGDIRPLVLISAGITLLTFVVLPLIPRRTGITPVSA